MGTNSEIFDSIKEIYKELSKKKRLTSQEKIMRRKAFITICKVMDKFDGKLA